MTCTTLKQMFCLFLAASFSFVSCNGRIPEMGDHTFFDVDLGELSGLCFNKDKTALIACGDKGVIKSVSFDGQVSDIWENRGDMEGVTLDPVTGDIYIAVERAQEVHRLPAPEYAEQERLFPVQEAVDGRFFNDGLEAVEYYKDGVVFVGAQRDATLWKYMLDGTLLSKINLPFASEIAGLCYEPEEDLLWVTDSEAFKIFLCTPDGELIATYDVPYIENAESICVDRDRNCVWVGSDEDSSKVYKIDFKF